jgi:hypothetical protein
MDYVSLMLFAALGGGISYIDRAYDDGLFSRTKALVLAPFMVAVWLILAASNTGYATLLTAILMSSLMAGKVDTLVFRASAGVLLIGLSVNWPGILWPSFIILTVLGILDEKGNDHTDSGKGSGMVELFFAHRLLMKTGVLGLALATWLPWTAFGAIMAFDVAYDSMVIIGARTVPKEQEVPMGIAGGS